MNVLTCYIFDTRTLYIVKMGVDWGLLKVERYTIKGLLDPTDVSRNQKTLVGKPTK